MNNIYTNILNGDEVEKTFFLSNGFWMFNSGIPVLFNLLKIYNVDMLNFFLIKFKYNNFKSTFSYMKNIDYEKINEQGFIIRYITDNYDYINKINKINFFKCLSDYNNENINDNNFLEILDILDDKFTKYYKNMRPHIKIKESVVKILNNYNDIEIQKQLLKDFYFFNNMYGLSKQFKLMINLSKNTIFQ